MYSRVNDALNEVLLGGRHAGRPLYLALDNAARCALADQLEVSEDKVEALACRIVGRTFWPQGDPYWRHEKALDAWNAARRKEAPPFTALLFTLSHAAARMASDGQFSKANYYLRLAEVTGHDRGRLSLYGKETEKFWRALASWLADTNHAHGRPTARQSGAHKYVSLAVSQAVVRAADRECLHHLFAKYGFTGSDDLSVEEMGQYIASWIHGSAPSKQLKAAWAKPELRPRVCEAALAELEEWAGRGAGDDAQSSKGQGAARLSLALSLLPDFPRRKLSLGLGRKWQDEPASRLATADGACQLVLDNSLYGAFATLSPSRTLDLPSVLRKGISLASASGDKRHEWQPRLVIPFTRSPDGAFWTEASRAAIGVEHLVLVLDRKGTRQDVEEVLAEAALPGYTCSTSSQLAGLPSGWVLYEGIRMMKAPEDAPVEAADLAPISEAGSLKIEGGLRLAPRIWHRRAPPAIHLDGAPPGFVLGLHEGQDASAPPIASNEARNGFALVDLAQLPWLPASGEIHARAHGPGGREYVESLLVRSARRPLPLDRGGRGLLAHGGVDTAVAAHEAEDGAASVRGLLAKGASGSLSDPARLDCHAGINNGGEPEPLSPPVDTYPPLAAPWVSVDDVALAEAMSCGERGFHWYDGETVPPGTPRGSPVSSKCRTCGRAMVTRYRGARAVASAPKRTLPPVPAPQPQKDTPRPASRVDHDLLLDALSFKGSGSWAAFEGLVAGTVDHPWEAMATAHDLAALGHIDLRRQAGSGRILAWSVAPAVLAFRADGAGFLAGFRNEDMVAAAGEIAEAAGGQLRAVAKPGQPALLEVHGLSPDAAASAFASLRDPHGRALEVVAGAAARLAGASVALGPSLALPERATLGRPDRLEAFDLSTGRWRACDASSPPGAYRAQINGVACFIRSDTGEALGAPHELAKLMAARQAGVRLHAHDGQDAFQALLGCEPPPLLRRVLVSCSGVLPSIVGGRLTYDKVPPAIGATVLDLMYPAEPLP